MRYDDLDDEDGDHSEDEPRSDEFQAYGEKYRIVYSMTAGSEQGEGVLRIPQENGSGEFLLVPSQDRDPDGYCSGG